jgi:hypothetical protein
MIAPPWKYGRRQELLHLMKSDETVRLLADGVPKVNP